MLFLLNKSTISSALVHKEENIYKSFFTIIKDFSTLYIKIYCHRCFAVQTNMYVATNVLSLNIHAEKSLLLKFIFFAFINMIFFLNKLNSYFKKSFQATCMLYGCKNYSHNLNMKIFMFGQ